eukprot:Skav231030  [mRNA]  locus=scaffold1869:195809:205662:- [translate_table: standard]
MARVGLKRPLAPGLKAAQFIRNTGRRCKALALLAAAIVTFSKRLPAANAQPPRFALRVCEKCVSRQAGNGYNPKGVLQQMARMAAEAHCGADRNAESESEYESEEEK